MQHRTDFSAVCCPTSKVCDSSWITRPQRCTPPSGQRWSRRTTRPRRRLRPGRRRLPWGRSPRPERLKGRQWGPPWVSRRGRTAHPRECPAVMRVQQFQAMHQDPVAERSVVRHAVRVQALQATLMAQQELHASRSTVSMKPTGVARWVPFPCRCLALLTTAQLPAAPAGHTGTGRRHTEARRQGHTGRHLRTVHRRRTGLRRTLLGRGCRRH